MKKEFVPYELAVKLKELGFDEICIASYFIPNLHSLKFPNYWKQNSTLSMGEDGCTAPLYQQAFRWFREKYNLFGCIDLHSCIPPHWFVRIDNIVTNDYVFHSEDEHKKFTTYEEAELACLTKLIEIVEQNKTKII